MEESIQNPALQKTAKRVLEKGRAGYQENMLEELVRDIGGTDNGEMKPALGR